jgi:uncharacterized protein (TIGR02246 family)
MTTTESTQSPDTATAEAEIHRLVDAAVEHQSDVEPFLALHTDDIVLVNLAGRRVIGKAVLGTAMTEGLKTRKAKVMTHSEVVDITFIDSDTAVVSCLKHITDENRDAQQGSIPAEASLTYVMKRKDARWMIALAQTTPIL